MRELIVVLVALAVVGVLEALFQLSRFLQDRKAGELKRRLQSLGQGAEAWTGSLIRPGKLSAVPALDSILRTVPLALRLEQLLVEADLSATVAQLMVYIVAGTLGGAVLGSLLGAGAAGSGALALMGFAIPLLVVFVARDRRSNRISEQLPDALDMMSRALRAGHAITNSFQFVASEMPEPINLEFGRSFEEQRLGRPLEESIVEMTRRVPRNRDLKIFAVSILVQKETGGNLTELLENISETIRARYRFYGKLRSLTAEGRMSGTVLASLPVCMMAFLAISNPTYLGSLFTTRLGILFFTYAVVSWAFGLFWMFRMTKVDY